MVGGIWSNCWCSDRHWCSNGLDFGIMLGCGNSMWWMVFGGILCLVIVAGVVLTWFMHEIW